MIVAYFSLKNNMNLGNNKIPIERNMQRLFRLVATWVAFSATLRSATKANEAKACQAYYFYRCLWN